MPWVGSVFVDVDFVGNSFCATNRFVLVSARRLIYTVVAILTMTENDNGLLPPRHFLRVLAMEIKNVQFHVFFNQKASCTRFKNLSVFVSST